MSGNVAFTDFLCESRKIKLYHEKTIADTIRFHEL